MAITGPSIARPPNIGQTMAGGDLSVRISFFHITFKVLTWFQDELNKAFKGTRITVDKPDRRQNIVKTIKGFVPQGGLYEFDTPTGRITVEVSFD